MLLRACSPAHVAFVTSGVSGESQLITTALRGILPANARAALCCCARRFGHDVRPRKGAGERRRIGDRLEPPLKQHLRRLVMENVVEAARSSIQTSFYTCDYSTKPNMTCGPMLKHMEEGMCRLEQQLRREQHLRELEDLAATRLLHGFGAPHERAHDRPAHVGPGLSHPMPQGDSAPLHAAGAAGQPGSSTDPAPQPPAASTGARPRWRQLTTQEDEARRRLVRLWSAANREWLEGCCLQAVQLLTGREVIRTHSHWRLFMKRLIWSAEEALRRDETRVHSTPSAELHALTTAFVEPCDAAEDEEAAPCGGDVAAADNPPDVTVGAQAGRARGP